MSTRMSVDPTNALVEVRAAVERVRAEPADHDAIFVVVESAEIEAAIDLASADAHALARTILLWTDPSPNDADGPTHGDRLLERLDAAGWTVAAVDREDGELLEAAIEAALDGLRPALIACRAPTPEG